MKRALGSLVLPAMISATVLFVAASPASAVPRGAASFHAGRPHSRVAFVVPARHRVRHFATFQRGFHPPVFRGGVRSIRYPDAVPFFRVHATRAFVGARPFSVNGFHRRGFCRRG
jgi:hypothetical protein